MDGRTPWLVALCHSRGRERERDLAGCVTWVLFCYKAGSFVDMCEFFFLGPFCFNLAGKKKEKENSFLLCLDSCRVECFIFH